MSKKMHYSIDPEKAWTAESHGRSGVLGVWSRMGEVRYLNTLEWWITNVAYHLESFRNAEQELGCTYYFKNVLTNETIPLAIIEL